MKKEVIKKFSVSVLEGAIKGVFILILSVLGLALFAAMAFGVMIAALWTVGAISVITANLVHGAGYSFGDEPIAIGFLLWIPIAVSLGVVEGVIELKKWLSLKWVLASGGLQICSPWIRGGYEKGSPVWIDEDGRIFPIEMKGYKEFKIFDIDKKRETLIAVPIEKEK